MLSFQIFFDVLLTVVSLVEIGIGLRVLQYGQKNNLPQFHWLALSFFGLAIAQLSSLYIFTLYPLLVIAQLISLFGLLVFVRDTFYKGKRSQYPIMLALTLVIYLIALFYAVQYHLIRASIDPGNFWAQTQFYRVGDPAYQQIWGVMDKAWIAEVIGFAIAWMWQFWAAWQALKVIGNNPYVEDWVKSRYRMILYSGAINLLVIVLGLISLFTRTEDLILSQPIGSVTVLVLQFLAWVMPDGFRKWLNRNYRPVSEDEEPILSETEIIAQLSAK